eukprot:jgi/Chlat1/5241/Chrsp33S05084
MVSIVLYCSSAVLTRPAWSVPGVHSGLSVNVTHTNKFSYAVLCLFQPASVAGSTGSRGSSGANSRTSSKGTKYKVVAARSQVDESLFGAKQQNESTTALRTNNNGNSPKYGTNAAAVADAVTLTPADLARIKSGCDIMTAEERSQLRKKQEEARERERATAMARKQAMLKARKSVALDSVVVDGVVTLAKARAMQEEELDEVKRMNQMVHYSKCVTIRDAQIEEKVSINGMVLQRIRDDETAYQRSLDQMMESERVRALISYEDREARRAESRRQGATVLQKQIEERRVERQVAEEMRDQERVLILKEIERVKEEEKAQVAAANADQIERKRVLASAEREDDERIAAYLRAREAREAELAEEAEARRREKEKETARLRSLQERANDKAAQLDELRALRAQESYERDWRDRERVEALRSTAMNAELARAREEQQASRVRQMAAAARAEQQEFERVVAAQRAQEDADTALSSAARRLRLTHKQELVNQINKNEEGRRRDRAEYLAEGARLREAHEMAKARVEEIRRRKLGELEEAGVPAKYRAELERKKISV